MISMLQVAPYMEIEMTDHVNDQVVVKLSAAELSAKVLALETTVAELSAKVLALSTPPAKAEGKEMTDDDARNVLFGDLKATKHKDAAEKLGLTYGQVYSCRLGFTFKAIHKEMKEKGIKNEWMK